MVNQAFFLFPSVGAILGFCIVGLGIFVLVRTPRKVANVAFGVNMALFGIWVTAVNLATYSTLLSAQTWLQFAFSLFMLQHVWHITFAFHFPRVDRFTRYVYYYCVIYFVLTLPFVYLLLTHFDWWFVVIEPAAGDGLRIIQSQRWLDIWSVFFGVNFLITYLPIQRRWHKLHGYERQPLSLLLIGTIFLVGGWTVANIGLSLVFGTPQQYFWQGTYMAFFYAAFTFYAVARHNLLDVRLALNAFLLNLMFLMISIVFLLASVYGLFPFIFPRAEVLLNQIPFLNVCLFALVMSLIFLFGLHPIHSMFTKGFGRFVFKTYVDRQKVLREFSEQISHNLEIGSLKKEIARLFQKLFLVQFVEISLETSQNVLASFLRRTSDVLVYDKLVRDLLSVEDFSNQVEMLEVQDYLRTNKIEIALPLIDEGELIGFVSLGPKQDKTRFNTGEIEIIEALGAQISVALQNARLFEELKRERNIIEAEQRQLDLVLSTTADAFFGVDQDFRVVYVNEAGIDLTGWEREGMLQKNIEQILNLHDQQTDKALDHGSICKFDESGGCVRSNVKLKGKHNQEKFVTVTVRPVQEGSPLGMAYIYTLHDITREHEVEQMKLDFVSLAAHELKTPLTILRGYLYFLITNLREADLAEDVRSSMFRAVDSTKTLTNLVDNLLDVSRIDQGKLQVSLRPIDIVETYSRIVDEMASLAKTKKLSLVFQKPDLELPLVMADATKLGEVMRNLIDNAIKYTREGSVTIWVEIDHKNLFLVTHIKDTGQGIPVESISKLFNKFYREEGEFKKGSKGTGLGLFIVKSIIDSHGGKVWVESEEGKGSTFSFSLPLS